jgi:hypothetical protein
MQLSLATRLGIADMLKVMLSEIMMRREANSHWVTSW